MLHWSTHPCPSAFILSETPEIYGAFVGANYVTVEETTGSAQEKTGKSQTIAFKNCIIAAGSQAVRLLFMPEDPRVVDSTGALELNEVPERMLILAAAWSAPTPAT